MFVFPTQAFYGKKITKEKIYQYASPTPSVKQQFVQQIDKIIWQYKLAPETVNIPASKHLAEIQVIDIYLKGDPSSLNEALLRVIDKAISMPLYYRMFAGEQQCFCMAYKRPNEADSNKWVVDSYFSTEWISTKDSLGEVQMPLALSMQVLYEQLLRSVITEPAKPSESLEEQVRRLEQIRNLDRELEKLNAQLVREKQFNRQVDINRDINRLKEQLSAIK